MLRIFLFLCAAVMWEQQAKEPEGPTFEVVSVKPSGDNIVTPGHPRMLYDFRFSGQRVMCDQQIEAMLEYAYSVRDFQIVGPGWLRSLTYTVDAIMPAGTTKDDARLMIRRMLADRFGLRFHREPREVSVYALVIAKGGPKLQAVDPAGKPQPVVGRGGQKGSKVYAPGQYLAAAVPMDEFAQDLSLRLDRPVVNLTGLQDRYRIELHWTPSEDGYQPGPRYDMEMLGALEPLGLKIEGRRMPYEVLIIDRLEKTPTEN